MLSPSFQIDEAKREVLEIMLEKWHISRCRHQYDLHSGKQLYKRKRTQRQQAVNQILIASD